MPTIHPASAPHAPFLNALLQYTNGDGYDAPVHPGDRIEVYDTELSDVLVVEVAEDGPVVLDAGGERHALTDDDYFHILASPHADALWEAAQDDPAPNGVAFADDLVPDDLRARLSAGFDRLCETEPADYHPGSGTAVRDLVHPSLYPYVDGVTAAVGSFTPPPAPQVDRWGRPYEASRFQWLPTDVRADETGTASFLGPIHNLDTGRHGELRDALAELLSEALPLLEQATGYAAAYEPWDHGDDDCEADLPEPPAHIAPPGPVAPVSLRGRDLQVITKLVQYEVDADNPFESVWHVEGMSHEHILATALYVLDRDEHLDGGTLLFRRGWTRTEAGQVFWNINQIRPRPVDEMVDRRVLPVGKVETPAGRLVVFPNSHIHRLTPMTSTTGDLARRRIVVFWLVDPDVRIRSTTEVPPQRGVVPRATALEWRLALMEERRKHKQSHNLREVSLCEH